MIAHKKADEQATRVQELTKLLAWLTSISECDTADELLTIISQPMPDYLLNGNRHPKAFKVQLGKYLKIPKRSKFKLKT